MGDKGTIGEKGATGIPGRTGKPVSFIECFIVYNLLRAILGLKERKVWKVLLGLKEIEE